MPSPSPGKFRGPMVRQLSLQNPTPASRDLKKQLSDDDTRVLESTEVTGQGWSARLGSGSGKVVQQKIINTRPKPVKVAWADRKPNSLETPAVEVIATKCQGQPRPTSLKTQRIRSPLLGNKDTLVYTRLQLAERLRNAWSEREKIKPNINISLARAPESTRSENEPEKSTFPETASALSDPSAPLDKKRKSMRVRAFSQEFPHQDYILPEPLSPHGSEISQRSAFTGRHLQELNKIEIRMTKIEKDGEGRENKPLPSKEEHLEEHLAGGLKWCRNKTSEPEVVENPPVSAKDRRANFRRSSILQKTITESFSSGIDENENKTVAKTTQKKPPLMRAFSAPSQSDQSDVRKAANIQKKIKVLPQRRLQPSVSFDLPGSNTDDVTALRERIKSASLRRKLKSAAARRKNKEKDSSDEEKESKDSTSSTKRTSKRSQLKKGGDIVTMVSLVSPAASDTEDSVINLPMESWREDEKQEQTQTSKSSSGSVDESKETCFVVPKFVSLRKATKSVTFQPHPVLNRSYSASFPLRRAPAGTPIIVPTPIISNPALTPAQLFERDKRATVFSGLDGRGIKRKLLRSSSESTKEDDTLEVNEKDSKELLGANLEKNKVAHDEEENKMNGEPEFKCQKERECWNLYQKMIEKGVSVSFDTVLRGMLTPTEYRLRKNQLLSNC